MIRKILPKVREVLRINYNFDYNQDIDMWYRPYKNIPGCEDGCIYIDNDNIIYDAFDGDYMYLFTTFSEKKIEDLMKKKVVITIVERK